ncbi:MAG: amino acid adenylation domain-containing protein, partial [bacterium]|nr:amino acid adenylation domain-containing protein [bacterium]
MDRVYDNISIGKPVSNTQIYIMDRWDHLQPAGIAGELCLSGDNLARGYLNQPELTHEKFARFYHTGDLARWLPDGNIEFLGRIDHQVKIRGYRVELGEIESCLMAVDRVAEVVVMNRTDDGEETCLCAYIVPGAGKEPDTGALKERLGTMLPGYMIPSFFVLLERFPLTPAGKLDRGALPAPFISRAKEYSPPR